MQGNLTLKKNIEALLERIDYLGIKVTFLKDENQN